MATARSQPDSSALSSVVAEITAAMADDRARHAVPARVDEVASKHRLDRASASTQFGDVFAILERGAEDPAERAIVSAFVAAGVVSTLERDRASAKRWAARLCWLTAHAGFDPLSAFDASVDVDRLRPLFAALADHARAIEASRVANADRAELIVAAVGLADAVARFPGDAELGQIASRLAADLSDATAVRVLTAGNDDAPSTMVQSGPSSGRLVGQLVPPPRSPFVTILAAFTGWLLVRGIFTLVATTVLGLRREARVDLTPSGVEVKGRVELLGRVIRDVSALHPLPGIASIRRDVRFPSLHLYAAIAALLAGSLAGVAMLAWGTTSQSPRLIAFGLAALLAGVLLDLALVVLVPATRGRARIVLVPRRGETICVGDVDIAAADRLLNDLARRTGG